MLLCLSCCSFPSCLEKDTTFEFERKRNRPERYDRNLAENTLKAIKKIDKVRSDRAASHIEKRFYIHLIISFMRCYGYFLESINVNRKSWQVEGQERQGAERGTKGIGAVDSLGQGSSSASTRPISHVTQDQSRGFSTKKREKSGNGRVILLASSLVCIFALFPLFFFSSFLPRIPWEG